MSTLSFPFLRAIETKGLPPRLAHWGHHRSRQLRQDSDICIAPLDRGTDRAMICGSLPFIHDMQRILISAGLVESANASPADFVAKKAVVGCLRYQEIDK